MVARYAGASLGLLAFSITVFAGLAVNNPLLVTLSRGILALFLFCLIGLIVGTAAERVVREHERSREAELRKQFEEASADPNQDGTHDRSTGREGASTEA